MQPDQPIYEEMVRRGSRGRWFWFIGSRFRTGSLAGVILILILWPVMFYFRMADLAVLFAALLLLMLALFALGSALKRVSCWIAAGEGLDLPLILKNAADREKPGGEDGKQGV